jgi:hypothetical protein
VPDRLQPSRLSPALRLIAAAACLTLLAGCATTKKAEADGMSADVAAAQDPSKAAQGSAPGAGQLPGPASAKAAYVDPVVSAQPGRAITINPKLPKITRSTAPAQPIVAADQPPPMQQGLITQPTGVRAGSFSIFSSQPPAANGASATGPTAGQGLAPINGSVYTPRTPLPPQQAEIPTIPAGAVIATPTANATATGQAAKPGLSRKPSPANRLQVKGTSVCVNDSRGRPINC